MQFEQDISISIVPSIFVFSLVSIFNLYIILKNSHVFFSFDEGGSMKIKDRASLYSLYLMNFVLVPILWIGVEIFKAANSDENTYLFFILFLANYLFVIFSKNLFSIVFFRGMFLPISLAYLLYFTPFGFNYWLSLIFNSLFLFYLYHFHVRFLFDLVVIKNLLIEDRFGDDDRRKLFDVYYVDGEYVCEHFKNAIIREIERNYQKNNQNKEL